MILSTIAANLATTCCALLLLRRGPSRRLRLLILTVGLLSLAQTAACLHSQGVWAGGSAYVVEAHQSLVACLSLLAIYLLGSEIYDRNLTDRKLRLLEHDQLPASKAESRLNAAMMLNKLAAKGAGQANGAKSSYPKQVTQPTTTPMRAVDRATAMPHFFIGDTRTAMDLGDNTPNASLSALAFALGRSVRPGPEEVSAQEDWRTLAIQRGNSKF